MGHRHRLVVSSFSLLLFASGCAIESGPGADRAVTVDHTDGPRFPAAPGIREPDLRAEADSLPALPAPKKETTPALEELPDCAPTPVCNGALPTTAEAKPWRGPLADYVSSLGARHRGRDGIVEAGSSIVLVGRAAYGPLDMPLQGEDVTIMIDRGCGGTWEKYYETTTSTEGLWPAIDGVKDDGGRFYVYVQAGRLPIGRHRFAMIVGGDGSMTDFILDVVPRGTAVVVTDVDGTLTASEDAEKVALAESIAGNEVLPPARRDAASILSILAEKGHRITYVTARPEWLTARTRAFLDTNAFPRGVVRTAANTIFGHTNEEAVAYKTNELALIAGAARPRWLFGNTPSDAQTYAQFGVASKNRVFIEYQDKAFGGRDIPAWKSLVSEIADLPEVCKRR